MWVIFLEAGLALALLLIIVWATRPRRPPPAPADHAQQVIAQPPDPDRAPALDDESAGEPKSTNKNDVDE